MDQERKGREARNGLACTLSYVLVFAAFAVFAFLFPTVSAQTPTQTAVPAGNAQAGRDLYLKYSCYACHSYDGHGGAGARLVPLAMTAPRFTAYIRNPRQMPPYSAKLLSDAQLADIWAYIKGLPVSPDAKDIPLLAAIMRGK